ncbi:hypothetical protein [Adhaeribacter aquaticus]|uniref:hypothetical protein n=1 Tax=Adhaeribacter aquaticus TaxID=299567 RepID=UPI00040066B8|nr:hypothetical protein [Adhaeribacter aquaticus]
MKEEDKDKSAKAVVAEGEKVTGGSDGSETTGPDENAGVVTPPNLGEDTSNESETKKEDMDSYNEHPDQAKVGGG